MEWRNGLARKVESKVKVHSTLWNMGPLTQQRQERSTLFEDFPSVKIVAAVTSSRQICSTNAHKAA